MVNAGLTSFKKIEETDARELELVFNIHLFLMLPEFYLNFKAYLLYLFSSKNFFPSHSHKYFNLSF